MNNKISSAFSIPLFLFTLSLLPFESGAFYKMESTLPNEEFGGSISIQ
jgi:hypothetical protein